LGRKNNRKRKHLKDDLEDLQADIENNEEEI
jgi:hypothetical protein